MVTTINDNYTHLSYREFCRLRPECPYAQIWLCSTYMFIALKHVYSIEYYCNQLNMILILIIILTYEFYFWHLIDGARRAFEKLRLRQCEISFLPVVSVLRVLCQSNFKNLKLNQKVYFHNFKFFEKVSKTFSKTEMAKLDRK